MATDDFDEDEAILDSAATHTRLARLMLQDEESEDHEWRMVLSRAQQRSRNQPSSRRRADAQDDEEEYENMVLRESDIMWEIGCKVSYNYCRHYTFLTTFVR